MNTSKNVLKRIAERLDLGNRGIEVLRDKDTLLAAIPDDFRCNLESNIAQNGMFEGDARREVMDMIAFSASEKIGLSREELTLYLCLFNATMCDPSLPNEEVEAVVASFDSTPQQSEPDTGESYEKKIERIRAVAYCTPGEIKLQSRTGHDVTRTYPEIGRLMDQVGGRSMVLDGEVVAFDDGGVPRFERIQQRLGLTTEADVRTAMRRVPVSYLIFDLLHLDGHDTTGLTYLQRRELLLGLELRGKSWGVPEHQVGHGEDLLAAARERHLEGVMAKRTDSRYEAGSRSGAWLKIKIRPGQELVIGGWQEGQGRRQGLPGSLLVGYYDGDTFRYAGRVGTGFTQRMLEHLQKLMKPLAQSDSPFAPTRGLPRKDVHFVRPQLVAEFEFAEWTRDDVLRAPSFKGLREDKDPRDVVREIVT